MSTDLATFSRKELYDLRKRHLGQLATIGAALIHWNMLIKGAAALSRPNECESVETTKFMNSLVVRAIQRKRELVVAQDGLRKELQNVEGMMRFTGGNMNAAELFREQNVFEGRNPDGSAKI